MTGAAGADVATHQFNQGLQGGDALKKYLKDIERKVGPGATVQVGFLADAQYPAKHGIRGTPRNISSVAQVAFMNEFGTSRMPARPFFRTMIESKSPRWGFALGQNLRATNYNAVAAMTRMGIGIQGQLTASIREWSSPPNAPYTQKVKGFNDPLVDEGIMLRSVDYQVTGGNL